jgi:voltage-gated potassium channel
MPKKEVKLKPWQQKIATVIEGTDTPMGKLFDILLLVVILFSILIVMLESVSAIQLVYQTEFVIIEFIITGLFSIEYILRILSSKRPLRYVFSFMGLVDLLSILPTFIGLFISGAKPLTVIRALRFLRIFRILELSSYTKGADTIIKALYQSRQKIIVFIISMLTIVIILGAIMYSLESAEAGFTSIPRSIYWAIITITTVGYGDITPETAIGQTIASIIMLIGYSIIAVPTGIVSAEIVRSEKNKFKLHDCPKCKKSGHDQDALHCKFCGEKF